MPRWAGGDMPAISAAGWGGAGSGVNCLAGCASNGANMHSHPPRRARSPRTSTRSSCASGSEPTATHTTTRCAPARQGRRAQPRRCWHASRQPGPVLHKLVCPAALQVCPPPAPLLPYTRASTTTTAQPLRRAGAARGASGAAVRAVQAVRAAVREDHGAAVPASPAGRGAGAAHAPQRGGGAGGAVRPAHASCRPRAVHAVGC